MPRRVRRWISEDVGGSDRLNSLLRRPLKRARLPTLVRVKGPKGCS